MFVAEDESVGLADSVKCLGAGEVVGIDDVANAGEVFVEQTSSMVLRKA